MTETIVDSGHRYVDVSNVGYFLEHARLVAQGVLVGALASGAALGFIGGCTLSIDSPEERLFKEAKPAYEEAAAAAQLSGANLENVRKVIPEGCRLALTPYLSDGVLFNTSVDTIVGDMREEPGAPCGDTLSQLRTNIQPLVQADLDDSTKQKAKEKKQKFLDDIDWQPEDDAQKLKLAIGIGSIFGVAGGLAWAIGKIKRYSNGWQKTDYYGKSGMINDPSTLAHRRASNNKANNKTLDIVE